MCLQVERGTPAFSAAYVNHFKGRLSDTSTEDYVFNAYLEKKYNLNLTYLNIAKSPT